MQTGKFNIQLVTIVSLLMTNFFSPCETIIRKEHSIAVSSPSNHVSVQLVFLYLTMIMWKIWTLMLMNKKFEMKTVIMHMLEATEFGGHESLYHFLKLIKFLHPLHRP